MKKLQHIFYILLLLSFSFGCTEDETIDTGTSLNTNEQTFRIAVSMPTDDTRVAIDGVEVTWADGDEITVASIGNNNSFEDWVYLEIDPSSISEDGKIAEFVSSAAHYLDGQECIAFHGDYNPIASSSYDFVEPDFTGSVVMSDNGSNNIKSLNERWRMVSEKFTYSDGVMPYVKFNHKSSLLELDIKLNSGAEPTSTINKIIITTDTDMPVFMDELYIDTEGQDVAVYYKDNHSGLNYDLFNSSDDISQILDNVEINSSSFTTIKIPVTWNKLIPNDIQGNFTFTIENANGLTSSVTKPIKPLIDGTRYRSELIFEQPEDKSLPDRKTLMAIYDALDGENWTNYSNWGSDKPLSEWTGVQTHLDGTVKSLHLYSSLKGEIPADIGNFVNIESLTLSGNGLIGSLPDEIYNLTSLQYLSIYSYSMSGSISNKIGQLKKLKNLSLTIPFIGDFPEEIAKLTNLENVSFSNCEWDNLNTIPSSLKDLNLKSISFSFCKLKGEIPSWIYDMTSLESIDFRGNSIMGELSPKIVYLVNLKEINFYSCDLTGSIPSEIGQLEHLEELSFDYNNFTGQLPDELYELIKLQSLGLRRNQLTGELSPAIGKLTNLRSFHIDENDFEGKLPKEIGSLSQLEYLDVASNNFVGPIPNEIINHPNYSSENWTLNPQKDGYGFDLTEAPNISIAIDGALNMTSSGGKIKLTITTDRDWTTEITNWSGGYGWWNISQTSGSGDGEVVITIPYHKTLYSRVLGITFDFEGIKKLVTISQQAWDPKGLEDFIDDEL